MYIVDMARKFPIGIQTFSKIREMNAIYVDKTELVYKLAHDAQVYFLARPRRFGKSLLISTLDDYFSGRKELFTGLAMEKLETEWKKHPVLRFDFSRSKYTSLNVLQTQLNSMLSEYESIYGKKTDDTLPSVRLQNVILAAEQKFGEKVVFLVDEYDAPLLDTLVDKETFEAMRQTLRDFYSPLKSLDPHLRFIFITGITKFSQLSIFSELNNLKIISMLDECDPLRHLRRGTAHADEARNRGDGAGNKQKLRAGVRGAQEKIRRLPFLEKIPRHLQSVQRDAGATG